MLHGVGYIGVRRRQPVFDAAMFRGIDLEGELVTLVLVIDAGNDDRAYCSVIGGEAGNEGRKLTSVALGDSLGDWHPTVL